MLNTQYLCSKQKLGNVLKIKVIQPSSSFLSTLSKQDNHKLQNLKLSTISLQPQRNHVQNCSINEFPLINHFQKNGYSIQSSNKKSQKWEMDYDAAVNYWLEKDKTSVHMEEGALKKRIESYIKAHNTCALATGSKNGIRNTSIEYNYVDGCFYFFSEGGLKFKGLQENKNVGIAICEPYVGFTNYKSVEVEGVAIMIEPFTDEYLKIMKCRKIPVETMKKLSSPMNLIKVVVKSFDYLDSDLKKEGFSNRQHLERKEAEREVKSAREWGMDYDAAINYWLKRDKTTALVKEAVLKEKIESYIKAHNTCALATGSKNGIRNTPIEYNYVDGCFYFFSEGGLKFKGLKENKSVSLAIYEPYSGFSSLKSVNVDGIASMIEPFSDEYLKILETKKIPVEMLKKLGKPMNLIKVTVKSYDYLDSDFNKEGFGYRQHMKGWSLNEKYK